MRKVATAIFTAGSARRARSRLTFFFGILISLNIQTAFNSPPMAMAAYYLKGVAPPHVKLTDIFAGSMPFVFMVFLAMFILYMYPDIALWLPRVMYGN